MFLGLQRSSTRLISRLLKANSMAALVNSEVNPLFQKSLYKSAPNSMDFALFLQNCNAMEPIKIPGWDFKKTPHLIPLFSLINLFQ
jgi:hypothetical protein